MGDIYHLPPVSKREVSLIAQFNTNKGTIKTARTLITVKKICINWPSAVEGVNGSDELPAAGAAVAVGVAVGATDGVGVGVGDGVGVG